MVLKITKAIKILSRGIAFFAWIILVIVRVVVNISSGIISFFDTLGDVTTLWSNDIDNDDNNDSDPPPAPKSLQQLTQIFNTAITLVVVVLILLAILFVVERILTLVYWFMEMIFVWTKEIQDKRNNDATVIEDQLKLRTSRAEVKRAKQELANAKERVSSPKKETTIHIDTLPSYDPPY